MYIVCNQKLFKKHNVVSNQKLRKVLIVKRNLMIWILRENDLNFEYCDRRRLYLLLAYLKEPPKRYKFVIGSRYGLQYSA